MKNKLINSTSSNYSKLPAYGKDLADRQRFNNLPFFVAVCIGGNAFSDAKQWHKRPEIAALALTPEQDPEALHWPVSGCFCVIEWRTGPGVALIVKTIRALLRADAAAVVVHPLFVDHTTPAEFYDTAQPLGDRWRPVRETVRIYRKEICI